MLFEKDKYYKYIGTLENSAYILKTKILIQNMKWKMDMHELLKRE